MQTKQITINFGLVASPSFPTVARERVLAKADVPTFPNEAIREVGNRVMQALRNIGAVWIGGHLDMSKQGAPTLVIKCKYPWQAEIDACTPPSVLKYEPYMRLYEVAAYFAQDCVAVLPDGEQGLLVGAGADKWGAFDSTKFITLD